MCLLNYTTYLRVLQGSCFHLINTPLSNNKTALCSERTETKSVSCRPSGEKLNEQSCNNVTATPLNDRVKHCFTLHLPGAIHLISAKCFPSRPETNLDI